MIMELKDAFLFLLDIFTGKLPLQDLYLLVLVMIVTPIAETIQEKRKQLNKNKNTILIYLKWIPLSFLAISIYLTGFYFVTSIFTEFFFTQEMVQQEQNILSIAIMSLTMTSIASVTIVIWRLYSFFIVKKTILTLMSNSLVIATGVYFINVFWYEAIIIPLWCYGAIGVVNTIFISFLLIDQKENLQSNSSDNYRNRTNM